MMSLKSSKRRMRNGFMCHSRASTAVCTCTTNPGSVVVPRTRTRRHERNVSLDDTRLINYANYSKLVEPSTTRFNKCDSVSVPNIKHQENESRELHKTPTDTVFQVVVMRVAIHCQGCAGKVKKHLSKMEGVTSFSVDVESKRVTVMGHISPVGVLESISKVKRAEFWNC
ncbi:Protein SODIUM POTASSIUM ROOT DEFECTIVE 1, partial [Mucuna pruriens]